MTLAAVLLTLWLLASNAHAEVIELEGKVKAVDADARTISIERKTAKGTKTLDLEVNKKAGDLSAVKVGDKISFSYDPELELVTKIGGGDGTDAKASSGPAQASKQVCRAYFRLNVDGTSIGTIQKAGPTEPTGKSCIRTKKADGVWEVVHTFPSEKAVERLATTFTPLVNVEYASARKAMYLTTAKKGKDTPQQASVVYPIRMRLPITVELDVVAEAGRCHLWIAPKTNAGGSLHPVWELFTGNGFRTVGTAVRWVVSRDPTSGKPEVKLPFVKEDVSLTSGLTFNVPAPISVRSEDVWSVQVTATPGDDGKDGGAFITRLAITGKLTPTLGAVFKGESDQVLVTQVADGSTAEKSGLKPGDVVLTVDGKAAADLARTMQLLAMTGFEESCEVKVQRDGSPKTITLTPEWPVFE